MTQELRRLAEAVGENTRSRFELEESGWTLAGEDYEAQAYIAAANPAAILALLDRMEKAEKDAARLEYLLAHHSYHYSMQPDSPAEHGIEYQWQQGTYEERNFGIRASIDKAMEASK